MGYSRVPTPEPRAYARPTALREGADDGTSIVNADLPRSICCLARVSLIRWGFCRREFVVLVSQFVNRSFSSNGGDRPSLVHNEAIVLWS